MSLAIYGFFYRLIMRVAHRFDWHYAPEIGPIYPDGSMQRWCKWCGFRASYQPRGAHTAEDLRAKIDHFRSHK